MQTIYPVFLQFMYNTHGFIYIQGTCNSFSSMPTFHCLYKLPFENFVIVMWRSCPVLIDVGWPGKYFVVPGAFFVFAKMFVPPPALLNPYAALAEEVNDGRANFPAQCAAGVRGRRQRCDALQAGQAGERPGQRESGVCS